MTRGQTWTLEGVAASVLVLAAVVFILQSSIITPLSASTTNQYLEERQQELATDVLSGAASQGEIREAIRYWDPDERRFHSAGDRGYTSGGVLATRGLELGGRLRDAFRERGISYNLYIRSPTPKETPAETPAGAGRFGSDRESLIYQGDPSDSAVSASTYITLYDDDVLLDSDGSETGVQLDDPAANFYAEEAASGDGSVYTVVEVEIVAWQS
ncbi:hypothetical protein BRD20_03590 [Halobacteriales archaeon SW_8_65_20]|nr:MAG: hypothetical protein BRD20_03590 [Halobacteriales archaeon SW_8_65_20]